MKPRLELAEEVPVALAVQGVSQAVMLATPADLDDFATGFALSEGWVSQASQVLSIEVQEAPQGWVLDLHLHGAAAMALRERKRSLAGRTGCGLCGVESLEQLMWRDTPPCRAGAVPQFSPQQWHTLSQRMQEAQTLHQRTGAVHAAAWFDASGSLRALREDVGRHNALDKLIGAVSRSASTPHEGLVLMSSRLSVELVHKAVRGGFTALAGVSAPTQLAVQQAQALGLALWGFVRGQGVVRLA